MAAARRGMAQTEVARLIMPARKGLPKPPLMPDNSAFGVDQDNSTIMRAALLEFALEGLLARMKVNSLDRDDVKELVIPAWLLAGELHRDLVELRRTETPPGRESAPTRRD